MGWFSPKNSEIYIVDIPEDNNDKTKLKGEHHVIVDKVKGNKVETIGCSSKQKPDDVKVKTTTPLDIDTYARPRQGVREIPIEEFNENTKHRNNANCTNMKEITRKLK